MNCGITGLSYYRSHRLWSSELVRVPRFYYGYLPFPCLSVRSFPHSPLVSEVVRNFPGSELTDCAKSLHSQDQSNNLVVLLCYSSLCKKNCVGSFCAFVNIKTKSDDVLVVWSLLFWIDRCTFLVLYTFELSSSLCLKNLWCLSV